MRDTCTFDYAITIPETINYVSSDCCLYERLEYEEAHLVGYDVVSSDCVLSQHFGFHSAVCDIFSGLFALASCISLRFVHFIGDLVFKDVHSLSEDLLASSSGQHPGCPCHDCMLSSEGSSPSSKNNDGTGSGISEVVLDLTEEVPLHTRTEIVECRKPGLCFIFRGLMFSLFGLRIAWRLGVAAWRYSFCYVRCAQLEVRRIIYRVQKTLRGSSGDIGWLQNATGMPSVEDGTTRFLELLQGIRNGLHMLPNSFVYLLIPGLFSNHGPLYFVSTKKFFSKMGLACHIAKIHSEASVEHNAWELKQYIEELYWGSGKCVMLLGHSKGGVDAAAALSLYWSDLKGKVAGLAVVQSPYGGTPIASDILREGQIGYRETRRIMELLICKFIKGDIRALEDLTYDKRREFLTRHTLPEDIPLISFHSEASIAPGVLATMAHIAHAELPWPPFPSFRNDDFDASITVPVVVPLSALMALSALHLQLRYGEKSDGVVTCRDAEIPGSVVVRPDWKLDHAWMVYSTQRKSRNEPDASEMCEAILTLLVELGRMEV